jgi:hypothetical protein
MHYTTLCIHVNKLKKISMGAFRRENWCVDAEGIHLNNIDASEE